MAVGTRGRGGPQPPYSPEVGGPSPPKNFLLAVSNRRMAQRNIRSFFVPAPPQDTATEAGKLKKITLQLTQRIRKRQIDSQSSQTQRLCVASACKACFSAILLFVAGCP